MNAIQKLEMAQKTIEELIKRNRPRRHEVHRGGKVYWRGEGAGTGYQPNNEIVGVRPSPPTVDSQREAEIKNKYVETWKSRLARWDSLSKLPKEELFQVFQQKSRLDMSHARSEGKNSLIASIVDGEFPLNRLERAMKQRGFRNEDLKMLENEARHSYARRK